MQNGLDVHEAGGWIGDEREGGGEGKKQGQEMG